MLRSKQLRIQGPDPRAPHIVERVEFYVLKESTGEIEELAKDHLKIFCSVEASNQVQLQAFVAALSGPCAYQVDY